MAETSSATQALWLGMMLKFLQYKQEGLTKIFCDSKSAIKLTKNLIFHRHSKHINIKLYFIRELVPDKRIVIDYSKMEDQVVDIFTKSLKSESFVKLKKCWACLSLKILVYERYCRN
ncbi:hypothetical protein ACH5RR_000342 [Cinchona calisaya]|uniref:Copia protein n=1 Tax=Cinchona calisaya TaxID=153742 RepID=A0ABD3B0W3_9GENT